MRHLLFLLFPLVLFTGCREDIERLSTETGQTGPIITSTTATVLGRVIDEDGVGIPNARVSINFNEETTTDASGQYTLERFNLGADGSSLIVTAQDYFVEQRYFDPEGGSVQQLDIVLNSSIPQGSINANTGGTFELPSGARISILARSVRSGGTIYTGNVNVAMSFDDPTSTEAMLQSPGNFLAFNPNGDEGQALASLGMIDVSLTDDQGNPVTINPEQPATLFFPVSPNFTIGNNDTIDNVLFWQLQELTWIRTGQANFRRNGLVGSILGGGTYNCDVPFPRAIICARLTGPDGTPLINTLFSINFNFGPTVWTFRTDDLGRFCASVAADQTLDITIPGLCPGDEPIRITIGPYPQGETDLGDITVDLNVSITPVHVEWCAEDGGRNFGFQDGLVWNSGTGFGLFLPTDGAGNTFLISPECATASTQQIQAVANNQRATSEVVRWTSGDITPIDLTVCSALAADESFNVNLDGTPFTMESGSYLLQQNGPGNLQHRFWGETVSGTDTIEFFLTLSDVESGVYPQQEITILGFRYQAGGTTTSYTCEPNCDSALATITETGPNEAWIAGNFAFSATEIDLDGNQTLATDLSISGTFRINR